MPGGPKRAADEVLIARLAAGMSAEAAARSAGVSTMTVYRRLRNEAFRARVAEARRAIWERTIGILSRAAAESARELRRLLRDADPKIRLAAARGVLDAGVRVRHQVELVDMCEEVKRLMEEQKTADERGI